MTRFFTDNNDRLGKKEKRMHPDLDRRRYLKKITRICCASLVGMFAIASAPLMAQSAYSVAPITTPIQEQRQVGSVRLVGDFRQGGLAWGQITGNKITGSSDGWQVRMDTQNVPVDPQGRFLLGFHRDEPENVELVITDPTGQAQIHNLVISAREYDIQRINGLPKKMVSPIAPATLKRIKQDSQDARQARTRVAFTDIQNQPFIWPAKGRISGVYGSQRILNGKPRTPHYGWDIAAKTGTKVVAPAKGKVTLIKDMYYSGWTILIDHGYGLSSAFLHLDTVTIQQGQTVGQGEVIGTIGKSGRATGPHLDWRMNWFTRRVDPALVTGAYPGWTILGKARK